MNINLRGELGCVPDVPERFHNRATAAEIETETTAWRFLVYTAQRYTLALTFTGLPYAHIIIRIAIWGKKASNVLILFPKSCLEHVASAQHAGEAARAS